MPLIALEDMAAYQLAVEVNDRVLELVARSPAHRDFKFAGQITDAASSLPSDIAEGYERRNPAEFANFVRYARASLREVIQRLPNGVAKGYYTREEISDILRTCYRLSKVLEGLFFSLRRQAERRRNGRRQPHHKSPDPRQKS
jgi:four helix bundle protein